jgi:hypothetical protein
MHGRYGHLNISSQKKYGIAAKISNNFWEIPISNLILNNPFSNLRSAVGPKKNNQKRFVLPWGGGAYFRMLPAKLFKLGVQSILGKQNAYVFYLHPWELDPQQPRIKDVPVFNKFRHYCNLQKTAPNLVSFIQSFKDLNFLSCNQYLQMITCDGSIES